MGSFVVKLVDVGPYYRATRIYTTPVGADLRQQGHLAIVNRLSEEVSVDSLAERRIINLSVGEEFAGMGFQPLAVDAGMRDEVTFAANLHLGAELEESATQVERTALRSATEVERTALRSATEVERTALRSEVV